MLIFYLPGVHGAYCKVKSVQQFKTPNPSIRDENLNGFALEFKVRLQTLGKASAYKIYYLI